MPISTAVDASAVARVVGIKTEFKDLRAGNVVFLPQRVAVIGQGATAATYSTTKAQHTTALSVGQTYGFGSPLHLAALQLLPVNGDGVGTIPVTFYPLDDDASGVAATGDITPSGTATAAGAYRVLINNIRSEAFVIDGDDTVATICTKITDAVNAVLEMPVIATDNTTDVGLAAKWKGSSGNDLFIEIDGPSDLGISFALTQMAGGLVNPDVTDATDQLGTVWESMILNCLEVADTDALDAIQTVGEGRWGALVRKPFVAFVGNTASTVAAATAVSDARKADRINAQLTAPGSAELPLVVAARQLARIVVRANNNPAYDYGSLQATGIEGGPDAAQWLYNERDQAVKAGSSTSEIRDGVLTIGDVVTFYHPQGDAQPAYRYVVDIVKLQNIIFNLDLEFVSEKWDGAPLIPDDQPTVNPDARQPKAAVAAVAAIIDSLADQAIISDPASAKANTFAEINSQNAKRLDLVTTVKLSGNVNILSVDLNFGFYFGGVA